MSILRVRTNVKLDTAGQDRRLPAAAATETEILGRVASFAIIAFSPQHRIACG